VFERCTAISKYAKPTSFYFFFSLLLPDNSWFTSLRVKYSVNLFIYFFLAKKYLIIIQLYFEKLSNFYSLLVKCSKGLKIFSSLLFTLSNDFVIIPLFSAISIVPEA